VKITAHHAFRPQNRNLRRVDQIVKQRAQGGLPIEDGDVDERHSGHMRRVRNDARSSRSYALVERRLGNRFCGLGNVEDSLVEGKKGWSAAV
jgi:hypothetical protein